MGSIKIHSNGKIIPYNPQTASMYARAIQSGQAEIIGDVQIIQAEPKKKEVAEVAEVNQELNESDVQEVVKPKRGRKSNK